MGFIEEWTSYLHEKKKMLAVKLEGMGIDINEVTKEVKQVFFPLKKNSLRELKIACIMDEFSYDSYKEECMFLQVTPDNWEKEINDFQPDLLFVESAWQGKDKLWYRKIANISKEYFALTSYCQENEIPVVFWNKEDPVYTDTFMSAAKCADIVFTTDIDCIKKYKAYLDNDRVYLLHFAAQPKTYNPIEKYERKDKFCFAGAYYHRYPKRAEVFDRFAQIFIDSKGFDIYDRNFQNSRPEHAFPNVYNPYILGRLEADEIDLAYKGYSYGVNMNSVDQSQTMFARRVFEMLASNTITVGNYSRGVKNLFGDLTICTNDSKTLERELEIISNSEEQYRKYRLLGLRKVLSEHLYEDRLNYVIQKVFGKSLKPELPMVNLVMSSESDIDRGIRTFQNFEYYNKRLFILGKSKSIEIEDMNIVFLSDEEANKKKIFEIIGDGMVGVLTTSNYYGKNYLLDLCLASRYSSENAFGKSGYYCFEENQYILRNRDSIYKNVDSLLVDRSLFKKDIESIQQLSLNKFVQSNKVYDSHMLSVDEFNFCENYMGISCERVNDLLLEDQGIPMKDVEKEAENIRLNLINDSGRKINCDEIWERTRVSWKDGLSCERINTGLLIKSSLSEEEKKYVYINEKYNIFEYLKNGELSIFFGGSGNINFLGVCIFLDENENKILPVFPKPNVVSTFGVPEGTKYIKLGVRMNGAGTYNFNQIIIGADRNPDELGRFISRQEILVLTNNYPSNERLYRNMFVHKRVKAYKEQGVLCDVMEWGSRTSDKYREFEGVNIVSGQSEMLFDILESGKIKVVCVHFMNLQMWEVLQTFASRIKIIIWIHGAEIQPWWRRKCNYSRQEEESAKLVSAGREALWKKIFAERKNYKLHFVFVSQQFEDEICEDYKVEFGEEEYSIIHNCIDTDLFSYIPKDQEQRKKILSIRPYASNNYANDLTVKCILELSKKEFFEDLSFSLYGDGPLFEETVKPLKKFGNVMLNQSFLRQDEIAILHKENGVFLVPTRLDTQGVSRDEAMSSGLVVITNRIAAVPEFTDEGCAIVVEPEDYRAMAAAVEKLYYTPEYFLELSKNARKRVEGQTSKLYTIDKEVALIKSSIITK